MTALDVSELHSKTTEAKWPRVQGVAQSGDGAAEGRGHNRRRLLDHPRLPANQLDER